MTTSTKNGNQGQNNNTEKKGGTLSSADALQLLFSTANAQGLEHDRVNPARVVELKKTLGRWKRPKIITTPKGVILQGADYVAALAAAPNVEAEVDIDRTGTTSRRELKKPATPVEALTKAGIQDAAFKLAVWRGLREGATSNPEADTPKQLVEKLADPAFLKPFEALKAPYDAVSSQGVAKAGRLRSKIAFAAFHLAYAANPKVIVQLYSDFIAGKAPAGSPLEKLLHAARHDNINSGSGRRPFMLKASILLAAQLAGEKVERASADPAKGEKAVQIFLSQTQGNA
jgi:hypothetical protein